MAACGSLQHIFEKPLPENPTLLESLSWNQIKPLKSTDQSSSFTEIFGELHFNESSPSSSSSSSTTEFMQNDVSASSSVSSIPMTNHTNRHKNSDGFSSLNPESLQLCTEGLGFESSDDVGDLKSGMNNENCWEARNEKLEAVKRHLPLEDFSSYGECRIRSRRVNGGEYPPPISCIGRSGKPWVCFRSYRDNGRFVLKEIRIPRQEFLHAYREDGRLKLHFLHSDDEFLEEDEDDDDDESREEEAENRGIENDDWVTDQVTEERE